MKRQWWWQAFISSSFAPYGENTRRQQWTFGCRHFLVANEKRKNEDECNSSLSYVATHEENKPKDHNEPSSSSPSFDILLKCPK